MVTENIVMESENSVKSTEDFIVIENKPIYNIFKRFFDILITFLGSRSART